MGEPTRMAEGLMSAARLGGVERLWFVSGSELTAYQEATAKAKALELPSPTLMTMIHEHAALCAAMGETMVTGRPSATIAHADLGLLHYGGAIHSGLRGGYPVLMMSGYPATTKLRRNVPVFWLQQRWDQGQIVRQYVKWDHKLTSYDDPFLVVGRALQVALSPPRGPVYLAIPSEVGFGSFERNATSMPADLGIPQLGQGDEEGITEIARRLLNAERPLIITDRLGNDVRAVDLLDEMAREFGIAVNATLHRMNIRSDHPSKYSGLRPGDCDVLLVIEHPVPWIPAVDEPGADVWIAVVGEDPLVAEVPLYELRANCRLLADPSLFIAALYERMRQLRCDRHVSARDRRWRRFEEGARVDFSKRQTVLGDQRSLITPQFLALALDEVLNSEDILVWEMAELEWVSRTRGGTLFESGGSHLGWAVGAALGARVANPERSVVCVTGDGSYTFGTPSALLWGQMKHEAPILTVICNNRGYRTGTRNLVADYPDGFAAKQIEDSGGMFDPPPDFAAEAESAGAYGKKILRRNDLLAALQEAKKVVEDERRPAVVDVWLPALVTGRHPLSDP